MWLLAFHLFASCSQITPLHSARTEGQGNLTLAASLDGTSIGDNGISGNSGPPVFPGLRAELAYGLTDKLDVIASLYSAGSIKASLKFQLYGDNLSVFSIAAMPGYEYQSSLPNAGNSVQVQRLHFPFMFNVRGSETIEYYVGPDIVLQIDDSAQNSAFPGFFGGIELGNRIRYNIGIGAYLPYTFNIGTSGYLVQFGASARIPIFRNE